MTNKCPVCKKTMAEKHHNDYSLVPGSIVRTFYHHCSNCGYQKTSKAAEVIEMED